MVLSRRWIETAAMSATTEIVIPPQIRAARALLGWSQEELATEARVAATTVRDMEAERRSDTAAASEVLKALRGGGVEFVPGTATSGPGVRLVIDRPNLIRRPQAMSVWDGLPLDLEFRGRRFTALISVEILEVLGEIARDAKPTLPEYLQIFDAHRAAILDGVRVAFERSATWSRDQQQLRVRSVDIRPLVPPEQWNQLVTVDPDVMGGLPVFSGTRVPIDFVLSMLASGSSLDDVRSAYPSVTSAHVEAARQFAQERPRTADPTPRRVPDSWKLKSRRVRKRAPKP
jgi:uncharacterized protein (DUF433 family)/DNA-binding transcriptional regulator YiaG